jgi:hypothetical protein
MYRCFMSVFLVMAGSVLADAGPVEAASSEDGRALARLHCSRCHVVPDYNTMGIGSTPSFKAMVQSPAKDWRHKFEAFFSLPPHGNFVRIREYRQVQMTPSAVAPIVIGLEDLDHLMAYVDTLAGELRK